MPKKEIDWDNPYTSEKYVNRLGLNLGVDRSPYEEEDTGSQGQFDQKGYAEAVEKAYANDYSTRRALEAANLAGEKDIPKNISSIEDAYKAHKWMKSQHEGGGKYSSDADRANITTKWVEEDRSNLKQGFTDDLNAMKESLLETAANKKEEKKGPVRRSDRLQGARDRTEAGNSNIFGDNNAQVSKTDERKDATSNFLEDAKLDLKGGLNLQPSVSNITNAANEVTNLYGR